MSNRKEAEDFCLKYIGKLLPGGENVAIYKALFASMDDKAFKGFMDKLESGENHLSIIAPNFAKNSLSVERNLKIADELGHNFFQKLWMPAKGDNPKYLTPIPYLVVDLPLRRQSQLLDKKISIPENNNSVDDLTGQPVGKSKGSKLSYPEIQVMAAMGLDNSLVEMIKYRGGDSKAFNAMNRSIAQTGGASLKAIKPYADEVEAKRTLRTFLTCMHLRATL